MEMNNLEQLYDNLVSNYHRVVGFVFGDKYYNNGDDVYSTHTITANDLIKEYAKLQKEVAWLKGVFTPLVVSVIVLFAILLLVIASV